MCSNDPVTSLKHLKYEPTRHDTMFALHKHFTCVLEVAMVHYFALLSVQRDKQGYHLYTVVTKKNSSLYKLLD